MLTSDMERWFATKLIPNKEGYRVVVLLDNGRRVTTSVVLEGGLHRLKDVPIRNVLWWRPAYDREQDLGTLHNTYQVLETL